MPLSLVVEDGSNVANANSFATLAQIRAACAQRGVELPAADDAVVALASQAMDYLATLESRLAGVRTYGYAQTLCFPRMANSSVPAYGLLVYGTRLPANVVPRDIVSAQCYLVGIATEVDLYGNKDTANIISEKVGPLQTDYSPTQGATAGPLLPIVTSLLKPYFRSGAGMLRVVRA